MTAEAPAAVAVEPRCPRCGTESGGATWCPKCGLNLRVGNGRAQGRDLVAPARSRRWPLAVGVVAALALAACAVEGVLVVQKQHEIDRFGPRLAQAREQARASGYVTGRAAGYVSGSSACYQRGYRGGYLLGWNAAVDELNKTGSVAGGNGDVWYDDSLTGSCNASGG